MARSHGESCKGSPEYHIWKAMKERCLNPNNAAYHNYGGRGITVCTEWAEFYPAFLRDVGRRPARGYTLDRIDNDKGYEPGNVEWRTAREQARNRRTNISVIYNGQTLLLMDALRAK